MAKIYLSALMVLCIGLLSAQTVLFTEDFENGNSDWVFVNHNVAPNAWYRGTATAKTGSYSVYVSNTGGTTYNYQGTTQGGVAANSRVHVYRNVSIPVNVAYINLNFDIRCTGESTYDYVRVYFMPSNVTPEASTSNYTVSGTDPYAQYRIGLERYNSATLTNPTGGWNNVDVSINSSWSGQTGRLVFTWLCDNNQAHQPPGAIDNITLTYQSPTSPPPPAVLITPRDESTFIAVNTPLSWAPTVNGNQPSLYHLYLDTSYPPQSTAISLESPIYTPPAPLLHSTTYYWQVVPANQYGSTPQENCPIWSFTTIADNVLSIGTGTTLSRNLPYNMYYRYSYSQTIYYEDELTIPLGSYITEIAYHYTTTANVALNDTINVYLCHTAENDFTTNSSWIPLSDFTLVYSGPINAQAPQSYASILFNEDVFIYRGGNIAVAVSELRPSYTSSHNSSNWYHTLYPLQYRSIYYFHDTIRPNVDNPQNGTRIMYAPNTLFTFILPPGNNLHFTPTTLDMDEIVQNDQVEKYILFHNFGESAITISAISGSEGIYTTQSLPFSIRENQQVFVLFFIEATSIDSPFTGTIYVESDADNGPYHLIDVSANVVPPNMVVISGGTSHMVNSIPLYQYFRYNYSQSIYLPSEINRRTGDTITRVQYHYNAFQNYPQEVTMYMGMTELEQFHRYGENLFVPINELTLVYDGVFYIGTQVDPVTGGSWVDVELNTEFEYDATKNLVIALLDNQPGILGSTNSGFYHKPTDELRSMRISNDDYQYDLTILSTGYAMASVPNIRLFFESTGSEKDTFVSPKTTKLLTNYPNPFNPSTNIAFELSKTTPVTIDIYNVKGQRVKSFGTGTYSAGHHIVTWNGADDFGQPVASGVYFYRMQTEGYIGVKKMLLLK